MVEDLRTNPDQEAIEKALNQTGFFWTEEAKKGLGNLLELSLLTPPARAHLMSVAGINYDEIMGVCHTVEVFSELEIPNTMTGFMERFCDPDSIIKTEKGYLGKAIAEALGLRRRGQLPTGETERLQGWIATFQTVHNDNSFEGKL